MQIKLDQIKLNKKTYFFYQNLTNIHYLICTINSCLKDHDHLTEALTK